MSNLKDLAIIVPVHPDDMSWSQLLIDLKPWWNEVTIVFSSPIRPKNLPVHIQWVESPQGRALQLNTAAQITNKKHFWFLHADTRLSPEALQQVTHVLATGSDALYFFDLSFLNDGPALMPINTFGTWLRSNFFGMPFGDQGFLISKDSFNKLGGFPEDCAYGEDHLFVWRARHSKIPVKNIGATLKTSARKYKKNGWLKTTLTHGVLTWKQALPEMRDLMFGKDEQ